jgi:hypothetical protein
LTSISAQLGYAKGLTVAEQLLFTGGATGASLTQTSERSVRPAVTLQWRGAISTSLDVSTATSDQLSAGNLFHTERDQQSGTLGFRFRPPSWLAHVQRDIRASARYSRTANTVCLQSAGQAACVPYVDSRQSQAQLSLDTEFPPNLSAGFQMAYLVNDERQANRKTSQLVITGFVELHTSVGRIQ